MPPSKAKVLLVEDDLVLGYVVKDYLQKQNYEVTHCTDGSLAWQQFMKNIYDVCLLDIMLPGTKDGLELSNSIREKNEHIPIILLSSKNMDDDRIAGFSMGADSYLPKPYNLKELGMRIHVFLKRNAKKDDIGQVIFKIGDLRFDYSNLILSNETIEHQLTQREADLIRYFCLNANRIITRNEILMSLWGKEDYFLGRSMDVFITKIRKYLKTQKGAVLQTIHGKGFLFTYHNATATRVKKASIASLQMN
jgi:DNA-binding response OmpR family regulator